MHRVDRGRVEDKTGRRDGEEVRAWSHCREEIRVSAAERTRADSLCTHSCCYFRPTHPTAARRVVIDPPSLLFSTRVPSFDSPDGSRRRRDSRLIRLSCRSATLNPVTIHKRVHPFTDTVTVTLERLWSFVTANVTGHSLSADDLENTDRYGKIVRSIGGFLTNLYPCSLD